MQELSNFLLKLMRGALEKPADEFQDWALNETKNLIPFDSCVWLTGRWMNETPVIHTIHLHKLGNNFAESWLRFQHEDRLIRDFTLHIGHTFNVDVASEYANTDIYNSHCKSFGVEHIIATGTINPDTQLLNSICFYRANLDHPFSERERALKEIVFPHLIEAARTNWLTNLPYLFSARQRSSFNALAACDGAGLLHVAMPSFVETCRREWPDWKGPALPDDLLNTSLDQNFIGRNVVINVLKENQLTLLRARTKIPADDLTTRELAVARCISNGDDYKTIANNLNIAPTTVKTHTKNIFLKLGINDKAKLASELSGLSL